MWINGGMPTACYVNGQDDVYLACIEDMIVATAMKEINERAFNLRSFNQGDYIIRPRLNLVNE
jgi:hypothetical protein